jgi:hypothetical protein
MGFEDPAWEAQRLQVLEPGPAPERPLAQMAPLDSILEEAPPGSILRGSPQGLALLRHPPGAVLAEHSQRQLATRLRHFRAW